MRNFIPRPTVTEATGATGEKDRTQQIEYMVRSAFSSIEAVLHEELLHFKEENKLLKKNVAHLLIENGELKQCIDQDLQGWRLIAASEEVVEELTKTKEELKLRIEILQTEIQYLKLEVRLSLMKDEPVAQKDREIEKLRQDNAELESRNGGLIGETVELEKLRSENRALKEHVKQLEKDHESFKQNIGVELDETSAR